MAVKYRVEINGKTVWSDTSRTYDNKKIPAEYRNRPDKGEVRIFVNDELIGVQTPGKD